MNKKQFCYLYAKQVVDKKINAPKYIKKQCKIFLKTADGKDKKYCIDDTKVVVIENLLKILIMPKGLKAQRPIYNCLAGFQWLMIIAVLCTVYRCNPNKRKYETVVLEICRKNGKTFLIAVIFILLFFLEPKFSKFYSVAPDGSLSREVKSAINEIISSSPALEGKFKIRRDDILCMLTQNDYIPLNYSNSRLDGKLPNVFLADEVGALPNAYAIEAMRSGQLTVLNKLGCIISTKYPTHDNPFEDEVGYAKKVLDGIENDESLFALLYEPDNTKDWATDDNILEHANPLALEVKEIMEDLKKKRQMAIARPPLRENFITKHCNIIYQGIETETYIDVNDLIQCRVDKIDWSDMEIYVGCDLAMSTDNCATPFLGYKNGIIYCKPMAFIPEDKIEEKSRIERVDYKRLVEKGECIACGGRTVDYDVIENYVLNLESEYKAKVMDIGYDRYNALSSAQKWDKVYNTTVVKQHSSVLHRPTKLLEELILNKRFAYEENELMEINFQNARCTYDTNLNRYVNKKKSNGKVDIVVGIIDALFLLDRDVFLDNGGFVAQIL